MQRFVTTASLTDAGGAEVGSIVSFIGKMPWGIGTAAV
jgi:hypothetical protein